MFNPKLAISATKIVEGYKCTIKREKCDCSANSNGKNGYSIAFLQETFSRLGYTYTQIVKNPDVVIYRVEDNTECYFEIFKSKVRVLVEGWGNSQQIAEGYTHAERYPEDNAFGTWAWCCRGLKAVRRVLATHFPGVDVDLALLQKGGMA